MSRLGEEIKVRVSAEMKAEVAKIAERQDRSAMAVVRTALREYLERARKGASR